MDTIHARKDSGAPTPRSGERVMIDVLPSDESFPAQVEAADDTSAMIKPESRGRELPPIGASIRVTYVRKDGLYERMGKVTHLTEGPPTVVNVGLLGEATRTQRRDHARTDASLNVDVAIGDRAPTRCVTKDVSGGGVSFFLREAPLLSEGQEFAVVLNVPDGRLPIRARCQAKFVREVLRGSRWHIGSQFLDITDDDRQRLVRFVFRLSLMHGRSH